jgi:hypothetical protein
VEQDNLETAGDVARDSDPIWFPIVSFYSSESISLLSILRSKISLLLFRERVDRTVYLPLFFYIIIHSIPSTELEGCSYHTRERKFVPTLHTSCKEFTQQSSLTVLCNSL